MAVAFGSIATATQNSGQASATLTITKPSGLAVGDLMIALLGVARNNIYSLSGWTQAFIQGTVFRITCLAKVADAGDVAAANFAFTTGTDADNKAKIGAIVRVTGTSFTGTANILYDADTVLADATPTYAGGVDPALANSLLIMGAFVEDGPAASTYAVANNNPVWTEQADLAVNSTEDIALSVATATYAPSTATGDYSLTLSAGSPDSHGYLLSIVETQSANGNHALLTMTSTIQATGISVGTRVSHTILTMTSTILVHSAETEQERWTNEERGTAVWTNQTR